jgi:hypothetical protein
VCGDSRKKSTLTRFYFLKKKTGYKVFCHNCGYSEYFSTFLKRYPSLYSEYLKDISKERLANFGSVQAKDEPTVQDIRASLKVQRDETSFSYINKHLQRFSSLKESHPARVYVTQRGLLNEDVWYTKNFYQFVESVDTDHRYESLKKCTEPRMIIPFWNAKGASELFQGRAFGKEIKYITVKINEDVPKIYGLNKVNLNELVYVTEGPIDSMFVKNSIAMAGSDMSTELPEGRYCFIYDNEPRSIIIGTKLSKAINNGHSTGNSFVIFNNEFKFKDINEAYQAGWSREKIQSYIEERTFSGPRVLIEFNKWKKC